MKTGSHPPPLTSCRCFCHRRLAAAVAVAVSLAALASLASCIAPPPPRTYNPAVAHHLWHLHHDVPVTPIPAAHGWGWWGGYPCWAGY